MRLFMSSLRHHRHPLLRVLAAVIGIAVLGFLFVFGLLAMATLLVVGVIMLGLRQWRAHRGSQGSTHGAAAPPPPPGVIEGEFVVVQSPHQTTH